ncbi:MAG: hypothetical protein RLZZ352_2175 [Pseudomonadota bacterium]|jgi:nucleoside-diphosphate-sugar epimerase
MNQIGALPSRFRRERILLVGCGDVGQRVAMQLGAGQRAGLLALTSSPQRCAGLRAQGITPLVGNLDDAATLQRLAGLAHRVLHLAPPPTQPAQARHDPRTRTLLAALARRRVPTALVYGSTTGVYGDRQGAWLDETAAVQPQTARAWRRVDAESCVHRFGLALSVRTTVLRIPGIYAPDRPGGTPRERLLRATPVLHASDDVYTNHIHADDLARACLLALWRGRAQRNLNTVDDTQLKMGDYFDWAADCYGLPRPPRLSRAQAQQQLPPMLLSFMSESRRLHNRRMKQELRLTLRYPLVAQGLQKTV